MLDRLAHGHARVEAAALEHDADALLQVAVALRGVVAEHAHLARRARAVALEDLDGGRLAGAVRAEQAEHLAALDLERHAAHGLDRPVRLAQVAHLYGGGSHPARLASYRPFTGAQPHRGQIPGMRLVIRSTAAIVACLALFQAASASAATLPEGTTAILSGNTLLSAPLPAPVTSSETKSGAVSQNGRFVAFQSQSDGLYDGDDDRVSNVYVRDRLTGVIILASRATGAGGEPSHSYCYQPAISDDGSRVAFTCDGPLDPADTNAPASDVYVRGLSSSTTHLVSRAERIRRGGQPGLVEPVPERYGGVRRVRVGVHEPRSERDHGPVTHLPAPDRLRGRHGSREPPHRG